MERIAEALGVATGRDSKDLAGFEPTSKPPPQGRTAVDYCTSHSRFSARRSNSAASATSSQTRRPSWSFEAKQRSALSRPNPGARRPNRCLSTPCVNLDRLSQGHCHGRPPGHANDIGRAYASGLAAATRGPSARWWVA